MADDRKLPAADADVAAFLAKVAATPVPARGQRGRMAEILNRKRALTLPMIRRLTALLDLPAAALPNAACSIRCSPARVSPETAWAAT